MPAGMAGIDLIKERVPAAKGLAGAEKEALRQVAFSTGTPAFIRKAIDLLQ